MASNINPKVMIAISKQINELMKKKIDGITIIPNQRDILDIQADITGPVDTPYEGGVFRCKLTLDSIFPQVPPKGYFLTKIFHPNVSSKGDICVIRCLLIIPFPESALNEEAGKLFMDNYDEYAKYAKLITQLHAQPKIPTEQPLIKKSFSLMDQQANSTTINPTKMFTANSMYVNQQQNEEGGKENILLNNLIFSSNLHNQTINESPIKMEIENSQDLKQNINIGNNQFADQLIENAFQQPIFMCQEKQQNISNLFSSSINLIKKENDKKKWMRRI